jgi:hypothetical protein
MENYTLSIQEVLKQVHPRLKISSETKDTINLIVNILLLHLVNESIRLMRSTDFKNQKKKGYEKKTLSNREIQTSVRLLLPAELMIHAVSEGTKALSKFTSFHGKKGKKTSSSKKAGIVFSISKTKNVFRHNILKDQRIGSGSPVYASAVLEYITAELLELAGNVCRDKQCSIIQVIHLKLAISYDEELRKLIFQRLNISLPGMVRSDTVPYSHPLL